EALEETGQRDNTVVIFTSDHGEMAGDHGLNKKGCRFYEGLVRVPLILSWPGRFKAGLQSEALVELTDIVPTLLEINGLDIPETVQGRSLLAILEGRAKPGKHRDFVRSVFYKVLEGIESYATMLRTRRYKIVNYHGHDLGELFDLEKDPAEFNNLWDDPAYADIRFELMKKNFDALAFAVDTGSPRVGRY
ncbi:MAG: sulfatase-like hydrolase/transferase, partial [Planctomycetes bacterium]|nr:sulfatase-like hydrolase/transferase [Planctomycetota bacterium]